MVKTGDQAPDFTVAKAGGGSNKYVEPFTLSNEISNGPIVLAFYPAAFTGGCTKEMYSFRDSMAEFDALDATVYGVSVDLPFAQNAWIQDEDLNFPMLSDSNHEVITKYDVVSSGLFDRMEVAQRSIFVIDNDGIVTHRWVRGDENPNFAELIDETRDAVAATLKP